MLNRKNSGMMMVLMNFLVNNCCTFVLASPGYVLMSDSRFVMFSDLSSMVSMMGSKLVNCLLCCLHCELCGIDIGRNV